MWPVFLSLFYRRLSDVCDLIKGSQNKRKDRNSSENEGGDVPKQATKQSKLGSVPNDSVSHSISVSEILNQTNAVLYKRNDQLNNSVLNTHSQRTKL